MITAIVFDVGGVIVRTKDTSKRRALEQKHGLPKNSVEKLVFHSKLAQESTIGKVDPQEIWQDIANKLDLNQKERQNFIQDFWAGDQLDWDLVNYLKECRPKYKTALLSNAWKDARQALAEQYHIIEGQTVDQIIISSEQGVAKPDEKIYGILREKLNCEFQNFLFIDDFVENIQAANDLGIQTIHYQPEMDLINKIKSILKK